VGIRCNVGLLEGAKTGCVRKIEGSALFVEMPGEAIGAGEITALLPRPVEG
jgi:hypothetical protein